MTFILGILIGLAAGVVFHVLRTHELRNALAASNYLRAVAERTVKILAREVALRDLKIINLGGSAPLSAPARRTGQHSDYARMAGPLNGGPHFLGNAR